MSAAAQAANVEVRQLRELLATDRSSAGEARSGGDRAPLRTIDYRQPLRVRLRRRWRLDRRLRVRSAYAGLAVVLCAALCVWWNVRTPAALASASQPAQGVAQPKSAARVHSMPAEPAAVPPVGAQSLPTPEPAVNDLPASALSAKRRLQRADLWLRVDTERGASEARALLESALHELPGSVHGQVALAEACLRLGDEGCARTAIHKAILARPWRAKYQALARDIDRTFGSIEPSLQGASARSTRRAR